MHYSPLNSATSPTTAASSSSPSPGGGGQHVAASPVAAWPPQSSLGHLEGAEYKHHLHHRLMETGGGDHLGGSGSPDLYSQHHPGQLDDLATYTTLTSAPVTSTTNTHHQHQYDPSAMMSSLMPQSSVPPTSTSSSTKTTNGKRPTATKSGANSANYNGKANGNGGTGGQGRSGNPGGKKTKGRVKIKMEFIDNKLRRYTTFSKRKTGIMKKAYELSTLTGTQVMLLVASETGHVYTFATRKLQPMITSDAGKALIQTCLNSPDPGGLNGTGPDVVTTNGHVSMANAGSGLASTEANSELSRMVSMSNGASNGCATPTPNNTTGSGGGATGVQGGQSQADQQRMSATGFEEPDLSYSVSGDDCSPLNDKNVFTGCLTLGTSATPTAFSGSIPGGGSLHLAPNASGNSTFFLNGQAIDGTELVDMDEEEDEEEEEEDEEELDDEESHWDGQLDDIARFTTDSMPSLAAHRSLLDPNNWSAKPPALGHVSDRTKMSLNLKLQQKQQQQQQQQRIFAKPLAPANQRSFQFQSHQQNRVEKKKAKPQVQSKTKKTAPSRESCFSTSLDATSSQFNFDPASFLDSCFQPLNESVNQQTLDSFLNPDFFLDSPNLLQSSIQLLGGGNANLKPQKQNSKISHQGARSSQSKKNTQANRVNNLVSSSGLFVPSTGTSLSFPVLNEPQHHHKSQQIGHSGTFGVSAEPNNGGNATGKQTTASNSLLSGNLHHHNHHHQQQQHQKAANLNSIINNLANNQNINNSSGNNGNSATGTTGTMSANSRSNNMLPSNNQLALDSLDSGSSAPINSFGAMAAAVAAQQLLTGNVILCTQPLVDSSQMSGSSPLQFSVAGSNVLSETTSTPTTTLLVHPNPNTSGQQQQQTNNSSSGNQSNPLVTGQLIYNALAGRLLYTTNGTVQTGSNRGQLDQPTTILSNGTLLNNSGTGANQNGTFSTLITADGQQLILNVAAAAAAAASQNPSQVANQTQLQLPMLGTGQEGLNLLLNNCGSGIAQLITSMPSQTNSVNSLSLGTQDIVGQTSQSSSRMRAKQEMMDPLSSLLANPSSDSILLDSSRFGVQSQHYKQHGNSTTLTTSINAMLPSPCTTPSVGVTSSANSSSHRNKKQRK